MTLDELKATYNIPHMLRLYGIAPNRTGFINCLCHTDKNASMKVYEKRLKCFSCGATLSIVDLCGVIHNESDISAIKRLIHDDLGLGYDRTKKENRERLKRLEEEARRKEQKERIRTARIDCRTNLHRVAFQYCKSATELTDELMKQQEIRRRTEEWLDENTCSV